MEDERDGSDYKVKRLTFKKVNWRENKMENTKIDYLTDNLRMTRP